MYIYKLNFLILNGLENTIIENKIDDFVQDAIDNLNKEHQTEEVEIVSVQVCDIAGENYGVCEICQTWVSDFSLKNPIFEFSNGVKIGEGWRCDICIGKNNDHSFLPIRTDIRNNDQLN